MAHRATRFRSDNPCAPLNNTSSSSKIFQQIPPKAHVPPAPPSESVSQSAAPLPALFNQEMLLTKQAENAVMARLVGFPLRKPSGRATLQEAIYSLTSCPRLLENSSYFESLSARVEDISWSGTWKYPPLPQNTSSKYSMISKVSSQGVSELCG